MSILVVSTPSVALAYTYAGYRWPTNHAFFTFDPSLPPEWHGAVYNGFSVWNDAGADFTFIGVYTSENEIRARNAGPVWVARAIIYRYWWNPWRIREADMEFNTYYPWSTTGASDAYDVQHVAAHEAGHWLALLHSEYYWATMAPAREPVELEKGDTWRRTLHWDDIAGIKYIYGTK
ncbi:matrixin family metalloprotease [Dehalococcoidales bacterium]|nr:matrixin family metalloprotease [Dehalococcoidales bacterium]